MKHTANRVISTDRDNIGWTTTVSAVHGRKYFIKHMIHSEEHGINIEHAIYPIDYITPWHEHSTGHAMYVLEGVLQTTEGRFGPGDFVWFPAGAIMEHTASQKVPARFLFITNQDWGTTFYGRPMPKRAELPSISRRIATMDWQPCDLYDGRVCYLKSILNADEGNAGMHIEEALFPKEYLSTEKTFDSGLGIYVLEGVMKTNAGYFGPDSFVWFSQGEPVQFGAAEGTYSRQVLITNNSNPISYA